MKGTIQNERGEVKEEELREEFHLCFPEVALPNGVKSPSYMLWRRSAYATATTIKTFKYSEIFSVQRVACFGERSRMRMVNTTPLANII